MMSTPSIVERGNKYKPARTGDQNGSGAQRWLPRAEPVHVQSLHRGPEASDRCRLRGRPTRAVLVIHGLLTSVPAWLPRLDLFYGQGEGRVQAGVGRGGRRRPADIPSLSAGGHGRPSAGRCGWSGQNGGWSGSSAGGGRAGDGGGSGRRRTGPSHFIGTPGGSGSASRGSGWGRSGVIGSPRVR